VISCWTSPCHDTNSHNVCLTDLLTQEKSSFCGLWVACGLEVPKFAASNPAEADRIFQGEKILSTPSFGREVKPSVADLRHVKDS